MEYTNFGKVAGEEGLGVGPKGSEITVADETGSLHQQGTKITASAAQINAAVAPTAATVPIVDAGGRFTGEDVETALQELAGAGRTNETVKGANDAADAAQADATQALADAATAQGLASTAMQSVAGVDTIRIGTVTLGGANPTPVSFQGNTAAIVTGTEAETFDLTGVGDGGTIILNPDGGGNDTATVNFAAGNSVSGANPSTNISAGVDNKFMISVDGDAAEEVTLDLAAAGGLDSGAKIATEMQTKIQALGGNKAAVTVTHNDVVADKYAIVSGILGTGSSIVVTASPLGNITEELKIGVDAGGAETAGTGDVANAATATAAEIAAVINADIAGVTADGSSGSVVITSDTAGSGSSIVMGNGTLNTALGLTNAAGYYGAVGLGYASDMANADYKVSAVLIGVAAGQIANKGLSINNKAVGGFDLVCQTAGATDDVDVVIVGQAAP